MRLSLFAKGSPLRESCRRRRLRGFVPEATLSVTASPCHLPRRWRLWQRREVYGFIGWLLLPLTGVDETYWFCQGLSPSGELSPQATERVRPGINPLRHGFAVPPPPKVEALAKARSLWVYRLASSAVDRCGRNLLVLPRARPSGELSPQATERVRPGRNPLRHGFAVPPLPKGRGFGRGVKFSAYKLISSNR